MTYRQKPNKINKLKTNSIIKVYFQLVRGPTCQGDILSKPDNIILEAEKGEKVTPRIHPDKRIMVKVSLSKSMLAGVIDVASTGTRTTGCIPITAANSMTETIKTIMSSL
jgi:hypothetical protein